MTAPAARPAGTAPSRPRRPRQGLGELESRIMDLVWSSEEAVRVRDVLGGLSSARQPRLHHRHDGHGQPAPEGLAH